MSNRNFNVREEVPPLKDKLSKIKVALFDVDGVLTDGTIFYSGEEVGFNRFFHASDGFGLKLLKKAGIKVGIITGGDSLGVLKRFTHLGVDFLKMGNEDKRAAWNEVKADAGVDDSEMLFMGDEYFDLPLMKKAGFSATVPHASLDLREYADYVTYREAGMAAAREVIDLLLFAKDFTPELDEF